MATSGTNMQPPPISSISGRGLHHLKIPTHGKYLDVECSTVLRGFKGWYYSLVATDPDGARVLCIESHGWDENTYPQRWAVKSFSQFLHWLTAFRREMDPEIFMNGLESAASLISIQNLGSPFWLNQGLDAHGHRTALKMEEKNVHIFPGAATCPVLPRKQMICL
ncbi:hypothetical protein B0H11DRAFT_1910097 [Mycena galericulata]|nr:hypothetical protein B0H11DRAFT_1910097 [Mycena galericulata]